VFDLSVGCEAALMEVLYERWAVLECVVFICLGFGMGGGNGWPVL